MRNSADSCGGARVLSSCRDVRFESTNARRVLVSRLSSSSSAAATLFSSLSAEESAVRYEALRLLHGVAEGPDLIGRIPLECDLDELRYVDFEKGCYMGQELTARTKYKV
jgi:folate-binding protein YgfZ